ncbi:hypothetical protein [Desulfovibrio inopinatus]|uniref:hypothetical protein n=1 Tax=Desulfovibrio inopinatus TaxID=102109 RepID=UPI0005594C92|nr:hypothetical protein [Desulfovibrio inopinatus]
MPTISASIVVFKPDVGLLGNVLNRLHTAALRAGCARLDVTLIDNSPIPVITTAPHVDRPLSMRLIHRPDNPGYGAGHNLAIGQTSTDFHLILNPDALLEADALVQALNFMAAHPDVGMISPAVFAPDGKQQYLCKRYPTVFDLIARGFFPTRLKQFFRARLDRYEMHDCINPRDIVFDPPIVSGCCMFCRTVHLLHCHGFDERFFLYFEDFDLSLRFTECGRLAYVPSMRIIHHGGYAARKGWRHIRYFAASAFRFYVKHGFKLL